MSQAAHSNSASGPSVSIPSPAVVFSCQILSWLLSAHGLSGCWASSSVTSIKRPFQLLFGLMELELSVGRQAAPRWQGPRTPAEEVDPHCAFSHWPPGQCSILHLSCATSFMPAPPKDGEVQRNEMATPLQAESQVHMSHRDLIWVSPALLHPVQLC